ncbi:hypothetical protein [Natronobiforma cellulositropha]|uniref:hypothetical protein n=1 Tax=Natronobiforma cellulositropha TaxID=1679076 RepID=UPI0021D57148|nr:hypothetical protein [Natronobiforma cellulositropha]
MAKISIGMLGWRFDEADILDEDGEFLPLEEMPPEDRTRIVRLGSITNAPCHACWLIHGDANLDDCNASQYVYGEPFAEVLVCEEHEPDFVYWYRRCGGDAYRGTDEFQDAFHEWFLDGGRAPEGYEGMEYVETDPRDLPPPPTVDDDAQADDPAEAEALTDTDIVDSGVDFGSEYPRSRD